MAETPVEIPEDKARENLVTWVRPTYPAIAKAAGLQGDVKIAIVVSKDGSVESVRLVSGHPMLTTAAMDAVRQWRYKPFVVGGKPASAKTEVLVRFSLADFSGMSTAEAKRDEELSNEYFRQDARCRELLKAGKPEEAEAICRASAETAEKLLPERQLERLGAYQMLGHSLLSQRKFNEALAAYQKELGIAKAKLGPDEAELGYAYHDMALATYATGDPKRSFEFFDQAISTLDQAHEHIGSAFLKNEYSRTLKAVLQQYALALRRQGDDARADDGQKGEFD